MSESGNESPLTVTFRVLFSSSPTYLDIVGYKINDSEEPFASIASETSKTIKPPKFSRVFCIDVLAAVFEVWIVGYYYATDIEATVDMMPTSASIFRKKEVPPLNVLLASQELIFQFTFFSKFLLFVILRQCHLRFLCDFPTFRLGFNDFGGIPALLCKPTQFSKPFVK